MKLFRACAVGAAAVWLMAVTPMSPKLDRQSEAALVTALKDAGLTEVATSSVLRSLEQVLGAGVEARNYKYREPYDHLAHVDAASTVAPDSCMKTDLSIWMPKQPDKRVTLAGVYCRTDAAGAYEWKASEQKVDGKI